LDRPGLGSELADLELLGRLLASDGAVMNSARELIDV
jgi:hypothetical protein